MSKHHNHHAHTDRADIKKQRSHIVTLFFLVHSCRCVQLVRFLRVPVLRGADFRAAVTLMKSFTSLYSNACDSYRRLIVSSAACRATSRCCLICSSSNFCAAISSSSCCCGSGCCSAILSPLTCCWFQQSSSVQFSTAQVFSRMCVL